MLTTHLLVKTSVSVSKELMLLIFIIVLFGDYFLTMLLINTLFKYLLYCYIHTFFFFTLNDSDSWRAENT